MRYMVRERKRRHHDFANPSVSPQVQAKLEIGSPGDRYEKQANTMAERVMMMHSNEDNAIQMQPIEEEEEMMQPKLRMQPMEEEMMQPKIQMQPIEEEVEMMQMQPMEEEEEMLQPKSDGGNQQASASLSSQLNQSKGGGSGLSDSINQHMSNAFGTDFSGVRVHTDANAVQMNRSLNARAFTHGSNIYFNKGEYSPGTSKGTRLLAHELTHVVQQGTIQKNTKKNHLQKQESQEDQTTKREEYERIRPNPPVGTVGSASSSGQASSVEVEEKTISPIQLKAIPDIQCITQGQGGQGCSNPVWTHHNHALASWERTRSTWRSHVYFRADVYNTNTTVSVGLYVFAKVYYGIWFTWNDFTIRGTVDLTCQEIGNSCEINASERGGSITALTKSPASGGISINTDKRLGGTQMAITTRVGAGVNASGSVGAGVGPASVGVSFPNASISSSVSMGTDFYSCMT